MFLAKLTPGKVRGVAPGLGERDERGGVDAPIALDRHRGHGRPVLKCFEPEDDRNSHCEA